MTFKAARIRISERIMESQEEFILMRRYEEGEKDKQATLDGIAFNADLYLYIYNQVELAY